MVDRLSSTQLCRDNVMHRGLCAIASPIYVSCVSTSELREWIPYTFRSKSSSNGVYFDFWIIFACSNGSGVNYIRTATVRVTQMIFAFSFRLNSTNNFFKSNCEVFSMFAGFQYHRAEIKWFFRVDFSFINSDSVSARRLRCVDTTQSNYHTLFVCFHIISAAILPLQRRRRPLDSRRFLSRSHTRRTAGSHFRSKLQMKIILLKICNWDALPRGRIEIARWN